MSKRKTSSKEVATVEAKRDPNARERRAIDAAREARATKPARAQYEEEPDVSGAFELKAQHNDEDGHARLVQDTFGTT